MEHLRVGGIAGCPGGASRDGGEGSGGEGEGCWLLQCLNGNASAHPACTRLHWCPAKGLGHNAGRALGAQGWQQTLTRCSVCRQSTQDDLQPVLAQLLVDYSLQSSLSV